MLAFVAMRLGRNGHVAMPLAEFGFCTFKVLILTLIKLKLSPFDVPCYRRFLFFLL